MANTLARFKKYTDKLDEVYQHASVTAVLDGDGSLVQMGANAGEMIIPKISMDGLADYSRSGGYVAGDVTLTNETVSFNYDRGRVFTVDAMDDEETAGIAFGRLAGEFVRTKVAPEMDAFRFAAYASHSGIGKKAADLTDGDGALTALIEGQNTMDEAEVPEDYLTARVDDYRRQYIEQNCNGDESQLADYVSTYYGKTVEEMEAYWNEGMEKSIRLEFIMDAIADELGVEVNQDDIDTYAEQLVSQNGYESVEAMYNIYGFGDTDYGKRYFADLYRYDQALDQLLETAVVTIDPSADTESDAVTEDAADATEAGSATNASTTYEAAEGTEKTGAAN